MNLEDIKQIIHNVKNINIDTINENSDFIKDLNCDSIEIFEIIMAIEDKFNIKIENDQLLDIKTVKDAMDKINNAK